MKNNPFANRETIYLTIDDYGNVLKEESPKSKQPIFETPLLYMYKNETTGTYAEFELKGVNPDIKPSEAIGIFMQMVREFGKAGTRTLPNELLKALSDEELDLFLLAGIKEEFFKKIKEMIYIQKPNEYYQDRYGFRYYIAAVGVKEAVLWYEHDKKLLILHTTPQQLETQGAKLSITRDNTAREIETINLYNEE
jgi:hypothetical protein